MCKHNSMPLVRSPSTIAGKIIASHRVAWVNDKHLKQWESTLKTYITPVFGALPVQNVDVALVLKALEPIWTTKPETAVRVRGVSSEY